MKVLIVRMYPNQININNYNCQEIGLAKALVRKGNICDIVLFTSGKEHEEDIYFDGNGKKIHIYYLKGKSFCKNAFFSNSLYDIVDKYDIIQSAEYDQIGNIKLRKKVGNKMLLYHGPYESRYTRGYKIKCFLSDLICLFHKDYKNTICVSKSKLASELLKKKNFKTIYTIGVGLDTDRFEDNESTNDKINKIIRERKENNTKYLLYVGKIEERRNILFLIDVLREETKKNANIKLIMIGNGKEKYVKKSLEYSKEKNVLNQIEYIKSATQGELTAIYKNVDLFLLPTKYEIFGMVLLEAMYFGIPVITTYNGGSSTLISDKKNGFICEENRLDAWTETIDIVLNRCDYWNEISNNEKRTIYNNFTWDIISERFIEVYKKMISEREINKSESN